MHSFLDSLLLGKIHVALLKLLISDVEAELSNGCFPPHLSISCNFLASLHLVSIKQCRLLWLAINRSTIALFYVCNCFVHLYHLGTRNK